VRQITEDDLDLVSMDSLVDAIKRRNDGCIIITERNKSINGSEHGIAWKGGTVLALGLVTFAQKVLVEALSGSTRLLDQ
jgi:hypothetical protein